MLVLIIITNRLKIRMRILSRLMPMSRIIFREETKTRNKLRNNRLERSSNCQNSYINYIMDMMQTQMEYWLKNNFLIFSLKSMKIWHNCMSKLSWMWSLCFNRQILKEMGLIFKNLLTWPWEQNKNLMNNNMGIRRVTLKKKCNQLEWYNH